MSRNKVIVSVLISILLAFTLPAAAAGPGSQYKDPFLAGVLSWVMPGAGQIYSQAYTRGSLFILVDLVDKTSLVLLVLYLNNNYSKPSGGSINWTQMKDFDKGLLISYIVLSAGFKVYNSLDAVFTAKRFNKLHAGDQGSIEMGIRPGPTASAQPLFDLSYKKRM
jgi:hypothetical protein